VSWVAGSLAVLGAALVAGFAWYERTHPTTRVLALVATLAALAALGRVAFAPLPNVKPTTDIVALSGYALGGAPGFAVGAVAALASNLFFGQGPWTPWQMAAWGAIGAGGAGLARITGRRLGRVPLALACGLAGLAFGAVMNTQLWVTYSGTHSAAALAAYFATSLPFDLAHAVGNVVFCLAFGPALVRALARYRTRFEVTWLPVGAAAGLGLAVAAGALVAARPPAARAQASAAVAKPSLAYLERAQNADGGWGAVPGAPSSPLVSGWAALGVAAAGRNPAEVARRASALAYVLAHPGADLGARERTLLVLAAAGAPTRRAAAALATRRRRDGSFAGQVNLSSFAVLALRAAGRGSGDPVVRAAARWIAAQANPDGGFNFLARGGQSGVDDTGAAVQALAAAGWRGSSVVRRATAFLARAQLRDGGFPLLPGAASNAQSTAWAVQGLLAAGRDPGRVRRGGRDPLSYLRSLTLPSGEVRYSRSSRQTPVWVTAQAVMALAGRPLPLPRVPRRRATAARPATTAAPAPAPAPGAAATTAAPPPARAAARPRRRSHGARPRGAHVAAPTMPEALSVALGILTRPARAYEAGAVAGAAVALV
jgi:energy-coupling factor transport system substrate-specific component